MIYFITPFLPGDLGVAYNKHIYNKYNDEDWICIRDMDTMILSNEIPNKLYEYIKAYPNAGIFTAYTNRIGGHRTQLLKGNFNKNDKIKDHKIITDNMIKRPNMVKRLTKPISGFFMMFKYSTFVNIGGFESGIFVDGKFSEKALKKGYSILLMQNIYIFHYYRLLEGENSTKHLE